MLSASLFGDAFCWVFFFDLKPANLLLTDDLRLKVGFGLGFSLRLTGFVGMPFVGFRV
jgi:hypothetical protein